MIPQSVRSWAKDPAFVELELIPAPVRALQMPSSCVEGFRVP
jgi:hypothetical protein